MAAFTALTRLHLWYAKVSDEGVKAFVAALTALTDLNLGDTEVGIECMKVLVALTALTVLRLDHMHTDHMQWTAQGR